MATRGSTTSSADVFIVEDHALVRLGLSCCLASHPRLQKCGEADNDLDALEQIGRSSPDVIILDLTLRSGSGLEMIKRLRDRGSTARIVVSSMHERSVFEARVMRAGAYGFVPKESGIDQLLQLVEEAAFHPELRDVLDQPAEVDVTQTLSDRELEVFRQLGRGLSTREIAQQLCRSVKTVETHRSRIKVKLGLNSPQELVRDAVRWVAEHVAA